MVGSLVGSSAHGQILGTGGTVGTVGTGLSATDFFIGAQSQEGINLNDRDRANFLNQASCQCSKDVWISALLQPSASLRAATVPATATVSMYVGTACDQALLVGACLPLVTGVPFSDFRLNGILVHTTVNVLARQYSTLSPWDKTPILGDTRTDSCIGTTTDYCAALQGAGGAAGTGGVGGTGGVDATGGVGGTDTTGTGGIGGTGLDGTGGSTATTVLTGSSSQTVYLFVSTMGIYAQDVADVSTTWVLDITPPCPPTDLTALPANEALITSWTAVDATLSGNDLLGYQLMCSRGNAGEASLQVFKSGTFTAAFDDRCAPAGTPFDRVDPAYVCSSLLSAASTSDRLKILENGIYYGVGVVAVDNHRNASLVTPVFKQPVATRDFYDEYRDNGYPQGQAQGGFCSVGDGPSDHRLATRGVALVVASGVAIGFAAVLGRRRRRPRPRNRPVRSSSRGGDGP